MEFSFPPKFCLWYQQPLIFYRKIVLILEVVWLMSMCLSHRLSLMHIPYRKDPLATGTWTCSLCCIVVFRTEIRIWSLW